MVEGAKTVAPMKHGAGKGLMKAPSTNQEKPPFLLHEDSKYALEQLSFIITTEDYEDLGNHSTEAMGETGLFAIAQLKNLKSTMEKKFDLSEKVRKELEQKMEKVMKALEDKDKEVQDLKDQLRQAKEFAICEYRDSDALLFELGDFYLEGFDDALRRIKKTYPDLDASNIASRFGGYRGSLCRRCKSRQRGVSPGAKFPRSSPTHRG
uniref:Uncharacterized protein n=1 Tax=Quercus lobata TaxID=97700 RepID=A0A7N2R5B2_QUELO